MDRYCDGDARAFDRLHAALTPRLRGYLIKLVRDEATADDLLQLTFLKAHLARERFCVLGGDPDGAVQGWYFAIARNLALDHLRQQGRRERREELGRFHADAGAEAGPTAELTDDAASVEQLALAHEHSAAIIGQVHEALAQLPQGQREVVELHKLQGMSMAEIAERLAIREGAARVRAHRGYKTLARLLGVASALVLLGIGLGLGSGLGFGPTFGLGGLGG
jgi:RNA polymerase sigma-70 factor, ECF subfamily